MDDLIPFLAGIFFGVCFTALIFCTSSNDNSNNSPKAIDVYRGKTTLQYTVVDSVVVDSCVIFKK